MSITWRIKVYDEEFTSRTQPGKVDNILTPADAFASLDSFDVDGAGNCLEARFRAVPSLVDIQPRDIVILEVSEDNGSSYTAVYRGYIVVAGNKRSKKLEAYKAVGLKQRFYEKINPLDKIDGADIATMADDVFDQLVTDSDMPGGVNTGSFDAPATNFELGDRYPQLENVGITFDYLAEQAGRFVVASGSTYTYDGVTYGALETVPAMQWGVDASGNLFFRRAQATAVTGTEDNAETIVQYADVSAETKVDNIRLVYANIVDPLFWTDDKYRHQQSSPLARTYSWNEVIPRPLVREFDFGGDKSSKVIVAADPVSLMKSVSTFSSQPGTGSGGTNVDDGDDNTYATVTSGSVVVYADTGVYQFDGFIAHVRFMATSSTNNVAMTTTGDRSSGAFTNDRISLNVSNVEQDEIFDLYIPFLPGANTVDFNGDPFYDFTPDGFAFGGSNLRVYRVEMLVPDVDFGDTLSEDYARRFLTSVNNDLAQVSQYGVLGAVSQTMTFTPAGESAVDVPVERIEYTLTTREGLVTTYHLGQAYDAELLSERAVLEALARRATR